jgi:hypothetical protein
VCILFLCSGAVGVCVRFCASLCGEGDSEGGVSVLRCVVEVPSEYFFFLM